MTTFAFYPVTAALFHKKRLTLQCEIREDGAVIAGKEFIMDRTSYPTPHNKASGGDFARTVLMPGDPLRSEYIARTFLKNAVLVNNVRGIQGYTGEYKGKRVSVMASGMEIPTTAIYSHELFNFYGVENIIRVGSTGSIRENLKLGDIVLAMGASTDSAYGNQFNIGTCSAVASYPLLEKAVNIARKNGENLTIGNIYTSDTFYMQDESIYRKLRAMNILCIDMETYGLYVNAARAGKQALTMLTVSDNIVCGGTMTPEERQSSFSRMITLALETAVTD